MSASTPWRSGTQSSQMRVRGRARERLAVGAHEAAAALVHGQAVAVDEPAEVVDRPAVVRAQRQPAAVDPRQPVGARAGAGREVVAAEAVPAAADGLGAGQRRRPTRAGPRADQRAGQPRRRGQERAARRARARPRDRPRRAARPAGQAAARAARPADGDQPVDLLQRVHEALGRDDAVDHEDHERRARARSSAAKASRFGGLVDGAHRQTLPGRARRPGSSSPQRRHPADPNATSSGPGRRRPASGGAGRRAAGPPRPARARPRGPRRA